MFARFADDGDAARAARRGRRRRARPPTPGTGLVAATALEEQAVVWIVTGLDDVGVQAAAAALDAALAAKRVRGRGDARTGR